jgi:hypothetical protein
MATSSAVAIAWALSQAAAKKPSGAEFEAAGFCHRLFVAVALFFLLFYNRRVPSESSMAIRTRITTAAIHDSSFS